MPDFLKALLTSRKFWLALVAAIAAVILYAQGSITADQLVDAILALAAVVIGGIAVEDAARSLGNRTTINNYSREE